MEKKFSTFNFQLSTFQRGFTLIELLVVIAVIGVLAGGVFVAINPLKRINQAKDANVKNDIGQVVQAVQAYYTGNNGKYPTDSTVLTTNKDLKTFPATVTYVVNAGLDAAAVYAQSTEDTTKYFCWDSTISTVKYTSTAAPTASSPVCN